MARISPRNQEIPDMPDPKVALADERRRKAKAQAAKLARSKKAAKRPL